MDTKQYFEMDDGNISIWIDGNSIQLKVCNKKYNDPVDLSSEEAKEFAYRLLELVKIIDD